MRLKEFEWRRVLHSKLNQEAEQAIKFLEKPLKGEKNISIPAVQYLDHHLGMVQSFEDSVGFSS